MALTLKMLLEKVLRVNSWKGGGAVWNSVFRTREMYYVTVELVENEKIGKIEHFFRIVER